MKRFMPCLLVGLLCAAACGSEHNITGENHGNISTSTLGLVLVQSEHTEGWGQADCLYCHSMANVHQTDLTGTGLNLEAIQAVTEAQGLDSCDDCHGTNGVQ